MHHEILGPHLADQRNRIVSLAQTERPVLICGEEGTGKSLYAAHLYTASAFHDEPLSTINISTSSERDQRLRLFGASFVQVTSARRSMLERPAFVVIKHIDCASTWIQQKLAEALNEGRLLRPGSIEKVPVRCKTVFTLRAEPGELHARRGLSDDLYQVMLSAERVWIPPLRERPEDIVAIAADMLAHDLSTELRRTLLAYAWPGNVTELKAYLVCLRPVLHECIPAIDCRRELAKILLRIEEGREFSLRSSIAAIEENIISCALSRTRGNRARAAQLLGITDATLRWYLDRPRQ
jgi:two-component system response regulator AtoC